MGICKIFKRNVSTNDRAAAEGEIESRLLSRDKYIIHIKSRDGSKKRVDLIGDDLSMDDKKELAIKCGKKFASISSNLNVILSAAMVASIIFVFQGCSYSLSTDIIKRRNIKTGRQYYANNPNQVLMTFSLKYDFIGSMVRSAANIKGKDYKFTIEDIIAYYHQKV